MIPDKNMLQLASNLPGSEPSKKRKPLSHTEIIKCPECSKIQSANVKHTQPFYSYVHECIKCKYIIMESEWLTVKPKKKKPTGILKDLMELKTYYIANNEIHETKNGAFVKESDVEAIINKYHTRRK